MTAKTKSTWMNPPIVTEVTKPRAHKTTNTTAIVQIISKTSRVW